MTAQTFVTDPTLCSVLSAATETRVQCLEILALLSQHAASQPDDPQLHAAEKQLSARLALLRGQNRKAILSVRATKQATTEARQEIDSLHLQLQNLYYEQRHLRGEIAGCQEFDHKYTKLPLVPVAEFLAAHPELADADDEHALTLARIADEHAARQALEQQKQALAKRKDALVKETTAKKEELARLDGELEKWIGGQEMVREIFDAREKRMAGA